MLKFNAREFIQIMATFANLSNELVELRKKAGDDIPINEAGANIIIPMLDDARLHCESIGLNLSIILIDELRQNIRRTYKIETLQRSLDELQKRMIDEISVPLFLGINGDRAKYFENDKPFGEKVADKFPIACFDIEEAGKCFSLGRYTACVMHLQRVMENGLKAYGKFFNVIVLFTRPQPHWKAVQPTWQDVLDRATEGIRSYDRRDKWENQEQRNFFKGIFPFLTAVKNAWRNPVMHAEKSFDEETTEDIFHAVKGFMHHLAQHLDESGTYTS